MCVNVKHTGRFGEVVIQKIELMVPSVHLLPTLLCVEVFNNTELFLFCFCSVDMDFGSFQSLCDIGLLDAIHSLRSE